MKRKNEAIIVHYHINGKSHIQEAILKDVIPFVGIKTSFEYIPFIGEKVAIESIRLYKNGELLFKNPNLLNEEELLNENAIGYTADDDEAILEEQILLYGKDIINIVRNLTFSVNTRRIIATDLFTVAISYEDNNNKSLMFNNPFHQDFYEKGMDFYRTYDVDGTPNAVLFSETRSRK